MRANHPGIVAKTALTAFATTYLPPVLVYYIFRQPLVILASLVIEVVLVPVVGLVYFITELCKGWAYAVGEASERFCSYGHNIYSIERLWRGEAKK